MNYLLNRASEAEACEKAPSLPCTGVDSAEARTAAQGDFWRGFSVGFGVGAASAFGIVLALILTAD